MRIGRKTINQDRGFLEFLQSKGWLATMINSEEPDDWMEIFIDYMENSSSEQEFLPWMQQFFILFIVRRHINEYIIIFRDINKIQNPISMDVLLNSRSNPLLQGHGIDVPMVNRTFKIGASMVIREVLRKIEQPSKYAVEHAFMPKQSIKMAVFGNDNADTSDQIYREIVKKLNIDKNKVFTFGGYYDIPILVYKEGIN